MRTDSIWRRLLENPLFTNTGTTSGTTSPWTGPMFVHFLDWRTMKPAALWLIRLWILPQNLNMIFAYFYFQAEFFFWYFNIIDDFKQASWVNLMCFLLFNLPWQNILFGTWLWDFPHKQTHCQWMEQPKRTTRAIQEDAAITTRKNSNEITKTSRSQTKALCIVLPQKIQCIMTFFDLISPDTIPRDAGNLYETGKDFKSEIFVHLKRCYNWISQRLIPHCPLRHHHL